jgi:CRP-like cAMP-binding protein
MSSNRLLARLSRADFGLLETNLEAVDLPVRRVLVERNRRVEHVYFPSSGFASVVANDGEHEMEIGMNGREGMTGVSVVLGDNEQAPHQCYMQVAGHGHRLSAEHLREAMEASMSLHKALLHYVHEYMKQSSETALANGRHKIEERLARWLLMADDRLDGHELPLTQEFLGIMLGNARAGVTMAMQELERRGWITHTRGVVVVIDREGLEKSTNGAYVPPSDSHDQRSNKKQER